MTIRLEMLRFASRARTVLGDSGESAVAFVRSAQNEDGGFRGRGERSDLYYTFFALETLHAMGADLPAKETERFLLHFECGESLDLVHLACLCRCWAGLPGREPPDGFREAAAARIESCRLQSGDYDSTPDDGNGSIYNGFLALGAYQDLGEPLPAPSRLIEATTVCGDDPTPLLAGGVILLEELGGALPALWPDWLLSRHLEEGGFSALPGLPLPDLLSTATALHALARSGSSLDRLRPHCLDFVLSLESESGGFCGTPGDDTADPEYTFYGLLAAGHLAV